MSAQTKNYLASHNVQAHLEAVLSSLVRTKPENPFTFLADEFTKISANLAPMPVESKSNSPLSAEHTALIKATVPVLEEHGPMITKTFYKNMFHDFPVLFEYFPPAHQGVCPFDLKKKSPADIRDEMMADKTIRPQQGALAGSVLAVAKHIDDLSVILPVVDTIAQKHCSLMVVPEQYDIVGAQLLRAIKERLGDAATEPIMEAWAAYYGVLAKVFIDAEKAIYANGANQKGGWTGLKKFVLKEKKKEAADVFSFLFAPVDEEPLPSFLAGQFIGIKADIPEIGIQRRNYSLSAPLGDNNCYRLSVRREVAEGHVDGTFSSWLHDILKEGDEVELSTPFGSFTVDAASDEPVVLLSNGVGQTPLVAIFEDLIQKKSARDVTFVRQCRDGEHDELHAELEQAAANLPNFKIVTFYSKPMDGDDKFDKAGRITAADLAPIVAKKNTKVYMCGGHSFQFDMATFLHKVGLPRPSLQSHGFGPMNSIVEEGWNKWPAN